MRKGEGLRLRSWNGTCEPASMKKAGILNSEISHVVSQLGHTDRLVICDAGLPIPSHVRRIDVALTCGVPSFLSVLQAVLLELRVEQAFCAEELGVGSPGLSAELRLALGDARCTELSHEAFKRMTHDAKAIIRSGECTPFANVILQAGVTF